MPLSELMGRDRVLYEAALAAGHSVVQVEQCTLRYELVQPDRGNRQYDYQYAPSDLGYVRIARSTMNASTLVDERSPVYEESSIHYPEYARAGRQPTVYEWLNCIQYYEGEQARKFEVPDLLKPLVGADTITPKEAEHIRYQIDFTDYSDPPNWVHPANEVYWPFRDVWWACSESFLQRQFAATKKFVDDDPGDTGVLWGNQANWEYYSHGRAVLLVQIRSDDTQTSTDSPGPLANDL